MQQWMQTSTRNPSRPCVLGLFLDNTVQDQEFCKFRRMHLGSDGLRMVSRAFLPEWGTKTVLSRWRLSPAVY